MNPVQHFEIPYKSRDRAKKFYFEAFGWQLFDVPGTGYSFATTVPVLKNGMPKKPGAINGGLAPRDPILTAPTLLVHVGDLRAHLARIEDAGGELLTEPMAMGPVWYARFRDPEGNVLGAIQDRPEGMEGGSPQATGAAGIRKLKRTGKATKAAKKPAKKGKTAKKASRKKR